MADCTKYRDMISSFADGELSEKENTEVMKHLDQCPACQALLSAYRSITEAAEESMEEPPADFSDSVMARIRALPPVSASAPDTARKKGKSLKPVIISFVAAAACLALAFIVSPQLFNLGSTGTMSASAPLTPAVASAPASSSAAASVNDAAQIGSGNGAASQAKKTAAPDQTEGSQSYGIAMAPQPKTGASPSSVPAASASPMPTPSGQPDQNTSDDAAGVTSYVAASPPDDAPQEFAPSVLKSERTDTTVNLDKYYAVVSVTGQLPELLKQKTKTENSDGTYNIEVPPDTAEQLIKDGFSAVMGNKDASTALIVYTP